jgi:hypothetical protein
VKVILLRCAQLLLAPFALLFILFLLGSGFGLAFVRTFEIDNRTEETVHVAAVGSFHGGGQGSIEFLPPWFPVLPAAHVSPVELRAGERRRFGYDMDDIQFTELLVHRQRGEPRMLVTQSPLGRPGHYYGLKEDVLVLENLDALPVATPDVRAQGSTGRAIWTLRILFLVGLLAIPLEIVLQRAVRRQRFSNTATTG